MKKIAVVTATRAEYGILRPLICRLQKDTEFELQLIVTGMHLSEKYGNTQVEIEKDKIPVFRKIPILEDGNSAYDVSVTMANALCRFAGYFRDEKPDMVIMDITMPNMDGLQALKKIREGDPNAKVVMCTAMGQESMVVDAIKSGARDFVVKPFDAQRIVKTVNDILGN